MRRILTIILTILLIISLLLTGSWLLSRRKEAKNGQTPRSFRDFFSLGDKKPAASPTSGNDLSPDTTGGNGTSTGGETGQTPGAGEQGPTGDLTGSVAVSQFTSNPLTPSGTAEGGALVSGAGTLSGGGIVGNGTLVPTGTAAGSGNGNTPSSSTPASSPTTQSQGGGCRESDVTITFTPEEITRLNALQNRFYQIAQSLHTDSEVSAELANYTSFKATADKIGELNTYCQSQAPLIQSPAIYKNRIATPFWRNPSKDVKGYLIAWPPASATQLYSENDAVVDPRDIAKGQSAFERILKLNLW